jgi:hypothetical protein
MKLKKEFEEICDKYILALSDLWEMDMDEYDISQCWIAGNRGDVSEIGDLFISFEEVRYIVDNRIYREKYLEYYDYSYRIHCLELQRGAMNIYSWFKGAPRISSEELSELEARKQALLDMQEEFEKSLKEVKENY